MATLVTILHVFVCVFLMITVLLQAGKGGGMGAAFGGGTSQGSVFGGSGAGNFLRKLTVAAAATFMLTSMVLAKLSSSTAEDALIRYSAQQRRADELRKSALDQGSTNAPAEAPEPGTEDVLNGAEGDMQGTEGTESDAEDPEGAAPADGDAPPTGDTGTTPPTEAAPPSDTASATPPPSEPADPAPTPATPNGAPTSPPAGE